MASEGLEFPGQEGSPDWEALYLYRKDEVTPYRPIFTVMSSQASSLRACLEP